MGGKIPKLPLRNPHTHKGELGTVAIIGGSSGEPYVMFGGTALCALAALRTGVGKCTLVMPKSLLAEGIELIPQAIGVALPETNGELNSAETPKIAEELCRKADCLVAGPAFGRGEGQRRLIKKLLRQKKPVVLDAGAIGAIAYNPEIWGDNPNTIMTPHVKEFERLVKGFGLLADRKPTELADRLAAKLKTTLVLKSSSTYITDGKNNYTLDKPNPALAAAGSGDVLAGILGGFVTQYYPKELSLFDCTVAAVAVHSKAGQLWSKKHGDRGILMHELVDLVPEAIRFNIKNV